MIFQIKKFSFRKNTAQPMLCIHLRLQGLGVRPLPPHQGHGIAGLLQGVTNALHPLIVIQIGGDSKYNFLYADFQIKRITG